MSGKPASTKAEAKPNGSDYREALSHFRRNGPAVGDLFLANPQLPHSMPTAPPRWALSVEARPVPLIFSNYLKKRKNKFSTVFQFTIKISTKMCQKIAST
ncbi:MAG: hypothetical protein AB9866_06775 [Syntrophobacteraceae bacterium]